MSEEEFQIDKEGGEWEQVGRGGRNKGESGRKRKKEDKDSVEDTESEGQGDEERNRKKGDFNVVVRYEGEGGVKKMDLLKITQIIRTQVGEVKYAKVLGDGNLLIGCNTEHK